MIDINSVAEIAAKQDDLTKAAEFKDREPLAEGNVLLRLREYLELGLHKGNEKFPKPKQKAKIVFETVSKKHREENADGKMVPRTIEVYFNLGTTASAGNRKLFTSMNNSLGGGYTHFAELIGKGFKATIVNNKSEKNGKVYSNLDKDGVYSFVPPMLLDDEGEPTKPIAIPEMHGKPKLFLWEMDGLSDDQIKEMWDDIYIEGEWEAKEANGDQPARPARSKNVIQEKIMENLAWEGSRTEGLTQSFVELDELTGEPVEEEEGNADLAGLAESAEPTPKKQAEPVADLEEIPGLD